MSEEKMTDQNTEDEEDLTIEEMLKKLEDLAGRLEDDELSVEESLNEYKKGMALIEKCRDKIDAVEKKVLVLEESGGYHEL